MTATTERPTAQSPASGPPQGRPRSDRAHRAILDAARELLVEEGFSGLRLEHVAARAGVGKATIYRHWGSRQELALELLVELAGPTSRWLRPATPDRSCWRRS